MEQATWTSLLPVMRRRSETVAWSLASTMNTVHVQRETQGGARLCRACLGDVVGRESWARRNPSQISSRYLDVNLPTGPGGLPRNPFGVRFHRVFILRVRLDGRDRRPPPSKPPFWARSPLFLGSKRQNLPMFISGQTAREHAHSNARKCAFCHFGKTHGPWYSKRNLLEISLLRCQLRCLAPQMRRETGYDLPNIDR